MMTPSRFHFEHRVRPSRAARSREPALPSFPSGYPPNLAHPSPSRQWAFRHFRPPATPFGCRFPSQHNSAGTPEPHTLTSARKSSPPRETLPAAGNTPRRGNIDRASLMGIKRVALPPRVPCASLPICALCEIGHAFCTPPLQPRAGAVAAVVHRMNGRRSEDGKAETAPLHTPNSWS
jgi:hypothetical protein